MSGNEKATKYPNTRYNSSPERRSIVDTKINDIRDF
jgi:hypothetical protein